MSRPACGSTSWPPVTSTAAPKNAIAVPSARVQPSTSRNSTQAINAVSGGPIIEISDVYVAGA
jgi:hypothetical protein